MSETDTLLALLKRHYIKPGADLPGGVFLPEVGMNGGWGAGSRCDAIYIGFTSSSGRLLVGHGLKVSRADWLNELNTPGKADAWADECHEWWLVVPSPTIVQAGELPAGWGLMHPGRSKTRMQVHKPATRKSADHRPSWDAVRSIIARSDTLRATAIHEARAAARKEAEQKITEAVDAGVERRLARQPDAEDLQRKLKAVEAALGAEIDWVASEKGRTTWGDRVTLGQIETIAAAVRAYGAVETAAQALTAPWRDPIRNTKDAVEGLAAALEGLRSIAPS
ncbi:MULTISPECIES: hypothetical protein [Mycobacterium]|uniref:Uncharacterized protein n=3 Tax=Mycobacterium TaxID=1763 RepID=A0A1X1XA86_9MYCO|nr:MULTISPECIES: hypothetical protein [Mycobacterium]MBZ4632881.1 hypothetical protein [Mycobacterium avium subsp. hominissuis]ORV95835.1 hypothetical protein AWC14_17580 [Mycobacterium kyorinense]PBJ35975.1 hypothetical protein XV03_10460 [Mycobacterium avium subsp. hominissuis]PBJ65684.1 hypothetical protein BB737_11595 [Mycobacterium avium subsp. hominissuis]QWY65282.1 hypothetical protein BJP78_26745 [Mycobacterium avium subsp. hominissuis]